LEPRNISESTISALRGELRHRPVDDQKMRPTEAFQHSPDREVECHSAYIVEIGILRCAIAPLLIEFPCVSHVKSEESRDLLQCYYGDSTRQGIQTFSIANRSSGSHATSTRTRKRSDRQCCLACPPLPLPTRHFRPDPSVHARRPKPAPTRAETTGRHLEHGGLHVLNRSRLRTKSSATAPGADSLATTRCRCSVDSDF